MKRSPSMLAKVNEYLQFRRGLGYKLRIEGQLLQAFAAFADAADPSGPFTIELALRWASLPKDADQLYRARRLEVVRRFARYLAITDSATEVPPRGLLGSAHRRTAPHIYSDEEVAVLVAAARRLRPSDGLRPHTYVTLIGLLACTGLRISEALRLARADADLASRLLKIRETKFHKSRLVALHPTAASALQSYVMRRDRLVRRAAADSFFISDQGQPLPYSTVRGVFRKLCKVLPLAPGDRRQPRLHDLRHTFACRQVQRWYDTGRELDHAISALSVYLGHAKVSDTYWYLTATPELMARAAARFESFVQLTAEVGS